MRRFCIWNFSQHSAKRTLLRAVVFILLTIVILKMMTIGFGGGIASYTRLMMHDMEQMEDIDYLLIGASRVYRGIDPFSLEEQLDATVLNAGTSSQRVDDSYYLLKYALESHKIENVVYDLWFEGYSAEEDYYFHRTTPILNNMQFGLTKIEYASNVLSNPLYALWNLSNITTYKEYWTSPSILWNNFQRYFFNDAFRNYDYSDVENDVEQYMGNGFVSSTKVMDAQDYPRYPFETVDPELLEYLNKIIALCEENNCSLYVISMPVYPTYYLDDKEQWHAYFAEILQDVGIPYLDFTTYSLSDLGLEATDFADEVHLNHSGAEIMTDHLAQWLKKQKS